MIEKMKPNYQSQVGVQVEITPRFLGEGWGRKLYCVESGFRFTIPSDGRAHAHGTADYLIPLSGNIRVAYLRPSGVVEIIHLEPGYHYRIPPNLPHQVEISGGMLEAYFPTIVFENKILMRQFRDFFDEAEKMEVK
ncbi:hypothetical protein [Peribacillus frigoritolerans]|uniref:hypothetical protein n=1 Tax=Peribacillus frigoritolerans TaxID=450367 RepID=UPI001F4F7C3B|nr:hypothetical protein [Peribacillus frigoritolerans]MCK2020676.1 hypothetical protein [Peribacillus frigoritolerans]